MYYEATVKTSLQNPYSLRSVYLCVIHVLAAATVFGSSFLSFFSSSFSQAVDAVTTTTAVAAAATLTAAAAVAAD